MNRVDEKLAQSAFAGLQDTINNRPALSTVASKFVSSITEAATQRRRIALLNLEDQVHNGFYQLLTNDTERFEVLSEKESHQGNRYLMRVMFYEKGEDLPLVRSQEDLISLYYPVDPAFE